MTPQLSCRSLYASPVVAITDVRCRAADRGCGSEEFALENEIVFLRSGSFMKHMGRRSVLADPNHVIFFNRHETYRVSHPLGCGDRCTSLSFSSEVLTEALTPPRCTAEDNGGWFPLPDCPIDGRISLVLHELRRRLLVARPDRLEVEEMALALLHVVANGVRSRLDRGRGRRRPETWQRRRKLVAATRLLLGQSFRDSPALSSIAAEVGSSPFHLTRIFGEETGMPVHRYRGLLRLREALERLAEGEEDLTNLALELGYSSHSHFTDTFRAAFGLSPSAFRGRSSGSSIKKLSKILEAKTPTNP